MLTHKHLTRDRRSGNVTRVASRAPAIKPLPALTHTVEAPPPLVLPPIVLPPPPAPPPIPAPQPVVIKEPSGALPLVSCIMPTSNRRAFVPQAIQGFLRQDYPNKELVIVDDGTDPIADCVPSDPRIRYVRLTRWLNTGAKRNVACAEARGEVIAHWDDDDWYRSDRLRTQILELYRGGAQVCGQSRVLFYDPLSDRAYRYASREGTPWVHGATQVYRRSYWERVKFPEVQIGEDVMFVASLRGKSLRNLRDKDLCVCMIHSGNTSPKDVRATPYRATPAREVHALMGADLAQVRAIVVAVKGSLPKVQRERVTVREEPLISCIMPTRDRRPFIPLALDAFQSQTYPNKELIVVDDGLDPIGDLAARAPNVRYLRVMGQASIGQKRNIACAEAKGALITHWDDDDWYSPDRLRYQAGPILAGKGEMTGLQMGALFDLSAGRVWSARADLHNRMFVGDVHGGTLMFRRAVYLAGARYPDRSLAEDAAFLCEAQQRGQRLVKLANKGVFVYMRHGNNAWAFPAGQGVGWLSSKLPPGFSDDAKRSFMTAARSLVHGARGPLEHALFIRTYEGDLPWLVHLLRSVARFVTGYDEIVVAAPRTAEPTIRGMALTRERVVLVDDGVVPGYLAQQLTKLNADQLTSARFITFIDSDCVLTAPFSPAQMMDKGRPIIVKTPYDRVGEAKRWHMTAARLVGDPVTHEYMRRLPLMYRRDDLAALRAYLEHKEHVPLAQIVQGHAHFSEFNVLGAFCERHRAGHYRFVDDAAEPVAPLPAVQFWSPGGITPEVAERIKAILG